MSADVLNRVWLPGNQCFGCGHDNRHGLRIEVIRDPSTTGRLIGRFDPPAHSAGFPGITHGGALFTAMDCLATWVALVFGPKDGKYWLLGSAEVRYRKAARAGEALEMTGWRAGEESPDDRGAIRVHTEIRNGDGDLIAERSCGRSP
jgi:acyl-coenzyme A thioesterase PaaI-like protein